MLRCNGRRQGVTMCRFLDFALRAALEMTGGMLHWQWQEDDPLDNDRMYAIAYNLRNVAIGVRQNDGGQQLLLRGLSTPGQGKGEGPAGDNDLS